MKRLSPAALYCPIILSPSQIPLHKLGSEKENSAKLDIIDDITQQEGNNSIDVD